MVGQAEFAEMARDDDRREAAVLVALLAGRDGPALESLETDRLAQLLDVARLNKTLHALYGARHALRARAPDVAQRLDGFRVRTTAMNRIALATGARLTEALRREGIAHVHMKGPLQQQALYGSPVVKPSGDIDVLVAERDRIRAENVIEALGYRRVQPHLAAWWVRHLGEQHFRVGDGKPMIDLHHRLSQPGTPAVRDHDAWIDAAVSVQTEATALPVLHPLDRCLVIAMNITKGLIGREPCLDHVVDLTRALERLAPADRAAIADRARARGLGETLAAAIAIAERVLHRRVGTPQDPLSFVGDDVLVAMAVTPWLEIDDRPRRRQLVWALCGRKPIRFAREAGRALAAEVARRRFEGRADEAVA